MIECSEVDEPENLEFVTIFDGKSQVGDLIGVPPQKMQILTLDEVQALGLGIENNVCGDNMVPLPFLINPPIIEEENSTDNLPAIGHLEEFAIQTAEDGTLLPSTVNAKMADGSHQRLTLFPEIVDGNLTCMVHFENNLPDVTNEKEIEETSAEKPVEIIDSFSLSQKIDNIISQNHDVINKSKMTRLPKKPKEAPVSLLKTSIQRNANIPKLSNAAPLKKSILKNRSHQLIDNEIISHQYNKIKERQDKFGDRHLDSVKNASKLWQPVRIKTSNSVMTDKILHNEASNDQTAEALFSPTIRNNEMNDNDILIENGTSFVSNGENIHPLGSTENPITLLQSGSVYQSQQPLSGTQLRQVSSILKSERSASNSSTDQNFVIDPITKKKIVYRVVFPDEDSSEETKPKRAFKRGRPKTGEKEIAVLEDGPNESATKDDLPTVSEPTTSPPTKVLKIPRTRSGRLSRPPKYIMRDYKRLRTNGEIHAKSLEADFYVDYKNAEELPLPPEVENPPLVLNTHRRKKKKNFKSEYRCPTCQKIYLGHAKMMVHLRKFPDHSNMDEYLEIYERARSERITHPARPLNVQKLKQMLIGVDKTAYGPILASTFTLWDFLLVRVNLLHQKGEEEVEALLKELYNLLEKLGKIAEELLVPVFDQDTDGTCIHLDNHQLAFALGLPQGTYKVNPEQLDLIRLSKEASLPPQLQPPPPRPSQLATKFEPNLSTKLLECSNDSIDLDCSSKDIPEPEDDKKWLSDKADETNSEFLSEFLQDQGGGESLTLWKANTEVSHVSPEQVLPAQTEDSLSLWKDGKSSGGDLQLWKDNSVVASSENGLWKSQANGETALPAWSQERNSKDVHWKGDAGDEVSWRKEAEGENGWKSPRAVAGCSPPSSDPLTLEESWKGKEASTNLEKGDWPKSNKPECWEEGNGEKDEKKDWLRQWKEDSGVPGMRTGRLTSTPETAHAPPALFSPPLRRNSVSSFAPSHQVELLSLDLNDLFEELMPEQGKSRRPKPNSIESIINEALFTENPPPPSHASLPPSLIPDALDEVTNLDFLNTNHEL